MAVVKVKEVWNGRIGKFSSDWNRTYTRTFRVETDNKADGAIVVGFAPGIPRMWDFYVSHDTGEVDVLARCRSVEPRQDPGNPYLWEVTCDYDTKSTDPATGGGGGAGGQPGGGGAADDPALRPPEIEWTFESYTAPLRYAMSDPTDADPTADIPVVNTATDPFDPLPEYHRAYPVLNITRFEPSHDVAAAARYSYALNAEPFYFASPGQAQLYPITAAVQWFGGYPMWRKTYRIRFTIEPRRVVCLFGGGAPVVRPANWQPVVLNTGYRELRLTGEGGLTDLTKSPTSILDSRNFQPVQHPQLLDENGFQMTPEQIRDTGGVWMEFAAYRVMSFAPLNLVY